MTMSAQIKFLGLMVWLALSFLVAVVGALASVNAGEFYAQLTQPSWAPPAWLFGPVWSTLYILMAIAAWRVWRINGFWAVRMVLVLYVLQLIVNALWSWLFFVGQDGALAMLDVVVLWLLLLVVLVRFWRIDMGAGILLLPYFAWVSFATLLTYTMWQLNPAILG